MAYSKRARASRARRRYHRRRYGRYKRKYRRYRRRYRRASRTEVKCVSKECYYAVNTQNVPVNDDRMAGIKFKPMNIFIVGCPPPDGFNYCVGFTEGTGPQQRIGAKISPIKLRLSGAISIDFGDSRSDVMPDPAAEQPNFWQIRLLIYQVRGGNTQYNPYSQFYHPLALEVVDTNGGCYPSQIKKLLSTYQGTDGNAINYTRESWLSNQGMCKFPLRRGIGGQMRVLYSKSFWINATKNPVKQFRIVTRRPRSLVWTEDLSGADNHNILTQPRNSIYICWMYQPGNYDASKQLPIYLSCQYELFYKDK